MFQVDDRVEAIVDNPAYNNSIHIGDTGIVVAIDNTRKIIKVEWDEFVHGHSCSGLAEDGYGWNVEPYMIQHIEDGPSAEISDDEFQTILGIK